MEKSGLEGDSSHPNRQILITDSAGTLDVISADACEETVREYLPTLPGFQPPQAVDPGMMEEMEMEMMGF